MATWKNNDREESKPTWLNKIQKRLCTRTVRGWEMPLMGSFFAYGASGVSTAAAFTHNPVITELLVTMPVDDKTSAIFTPRTGPTGSSWGQGATSGSDLPNYAPYFSCPFNGDSATGGANVGDAGVSHAFFNYIATMAGGTFGGAGLTPGRAGGIGFQYGVNKYGVSSLGGLTGVTAYIKVVVNDANFTNTISIGLSGTNTGCTVYTGATDLNDITKVPTAVVETFFGATSTDDHIIPYRYDNIAVLAVAGSAATGIKTINLKAQDSLGGAVGASAFTSFRVFFDRDPGLTTGGATAGGANPPKMSDYYYLNYNKSN